MNEREVLELMRRVIECGDFVGRLGMLNEIERRLSALPAPDEKLGTLPPSKTLNECREVFRRVAKRGPCLSSPDLHGIAAVRDFLTLDEEAFRRNWGPRDEDDDEKCEGGECRHGFDAGGGERLTECEKHGGKTSAQPLTGGEGVPAWVPSVEEIQQFIDDGREGDLRALIFSRYVEWRAAHLVEEPGFDKGWDAAKRRFDERAHRPAPQPSVEEMAERLLNAQLKHYGLSPRAWAQVGEEERAYWLALARAAIGGGK